MEQNNNAAEGGGAPPQSSSLLTSVIRFLMIFYAIQVFMNAGSQQARTSNHIPVKNHEDDSEIRGRQPFVEEHTGGSSQYSPARSKVHACHWKPGSLMNLDVFITTSEEWQVPQNYFSPSNRNRHVTAVDDKMLLAAWQEQNLAFNSSGINSRESSVTIPITFDMANNETGIFAHVYLSLAAQGDTDFTKKVVPMIKYKLRKKASTARNLLDNSSQKASAIVETSDGSVLGSASRKLDEDVVLAYLKPTLSLEVVDYHSPFPRGGIPKQFREYMDFDDKTDNYYPILYPSEFWLSSKDLVAINGTITNATLNFSIRSNSIWKWQLMSGMEKQWEVQDSLSGGNGESDIIRTMLLDTNPWLLAITGLVSLLHSIFDFLAFKNEITFFKGKRSMEGLSVRSMFVNFFFQLVIFLYLLDNDTSYMVLMSNGVGIAIEFWKLTKAVKFSFENGAISWKENESYRSKTKEYDEIATSHLLFVTMPLVVGYGVYSLFHLKHKSWYSWVLNTMVGFIYMFGFIMMTPQLFINYKLKSVAHLNWRTMSYKFINTFIDDLFAFVIKMPLMHRLACLRDDIIFLIFLYQRRVYRTDFSRVNEFGQCEQPSQEMIKEVAITENLTDLLQPNPEPDRKRRGARDKID